MPAEKKKARADERSARQMFVQELARLRAEADWSYRELGAKVGYDFSHLYKMEHDGSLGSAEIVADLDALYGTTPHLTLLWRLAKVEAFRSKYLPYMRTEAEASVLHMYATCILPGLLQTEAYARELIESAEPLTDDVEDQVSARLARRSVLTGADRLDFRAVLDEAVLRRPLRDPVAWRDQLAHLIEMARWPNVTLQLLPFSVGHHGLSNTHTILMWMPNGTSVGYTETGYSGNLIESPSGLDRLRIAYDRLRDVALPPPETVAFIEQLVEELSCDPPEST
ncbi:helix-turn-helix domain-containing protein [Streptomyces millisiae]|uniref:Helix-turn-helix transcriptional regulator n=1 Tax=Streptomyces millisiae TaxID=3075542 RepID=A0ABU2LR56_9ACTN|nr:helix-turn-helix transcriptional regulator [Streptomyces sp. DSM 44918]MDT0320069.1 helix-turn-helix transcriptional regulator [Streptomyces sp. DSM 44918]